MSDSSIIKEFLVALGFQVDVESTRDFEQAIDRATKVAIGLATTLEALAAAAVAAVTKVSNQFEQLYYSSQRVQSTVGNIRAFDYAISQLGGSAGAAQESLENFGDALRSNPAMEGMLTGLGIRTRDAHGHLRQTTDMLVEFGRLAKGMPLYEARGYAQMLGIDNRTLDALMRDPTAFIKHYLDMIKQSGVDQDKAAEASARWAQRWRDLTNRLVLWTDKLALMLQGPMGRLIDWFEKANRETHGLSTEMIALAALLTPLLLVLDPIVVAVLGLAGAFAALAADFQSFKSGAGSAINWGPWVKDIDKIGKDLSSLTGDLSKLISGVGMDLGPAASSGFSVLLKWIDACIKELDHLVRAMDAVKHGKWGEAAAETGKAVVDSPLGRLVGAARRSVDDHPAVRPAPKLLDGVRARLLQYHDYLRSKGLDEIHVEGVLAGMTAENGKLNPTAKNPTSGAFGLGQWLGRRLDGLRAMYGTHPDWQQQLDFLVSELNGGDRGGKAVLGARSVEDVMSKYLAAFMRPGPGLSGDLARGHRFLAGNPFGSSVQINQSTVINVHGPDPATTAHRVAAEQGRVNGNMVRYGKAAAS